MFEKFRDFFMTGAGRYVAVILLIVAIGIAFFSFLHSFRKSDAQQYSDAPMFIDAQTGQSFHYQLHIGDSIPVLSPFTGQKTAYPADFSWWSKDGTILDTPEPVLMNSWIGKSGPTFAPISGRLVTPHEAPPAPGSKPPPTRDEYYAELAEQQQDANNNGDVQPDPMPDQRAR
jgi:hypothetical protein